MTRNYWFVMLAYIVMQFSSLVGMPFIRKLFDLNDFQAFSYWSVISFTLGLLVILHLMKPAMRQGFDRNATSISTTIGWIILGAFMAYGAQIAAVLIEFALGIQQGSANTQQIMDLTRAAPLFMIIPALIAPILEEILFRKIIFSSLYKKTGFFLAALISSIIFGIIHGEPKHLLVYASMGFVFAFLYIKTKRIIVPIAVHMALNSFVVILQYMMKPEDIERMQKQVENLQMIVFGGSYF